MPNMITDKDAQYALEIVKRICSDVGPGNPGSSQERARAEVIRGELEAYLGKENVSVEDFTLAPRAWLSAYPLSALFILIAAAAYVCNGNIFDKPSLIAGIISLVFSIFAPAIFIIQFVFNVELVDPFLRKTSSINVTGKLRKQETQSARRMIILSGHHDSAPANTWFGILNGMKRYLMRDDPNNKELEYKWLTILGKIFYIISSIWFFGFLTMLAFSAFQLAGILLGNSNFIRIGTANWLLIVVIIIPSIIFPLFFNHGWKGGGVVPGAVDNLSACAIVAALCRSLAENPDVIPEDTEIRFITFGSEEAGLRGSRQYVKRHLIELKQMNTRMLNIETVADPQINILTAEGSGAVKVSPEQVRSLAEAAERAGVPYKVTSPWLGAGGDAAPFCKEGIKASTVLSFQMPQHIIAFYHQKWDKPDILTTEALLNMLKLTSEWICSSEE